MLRCSADPKLLGTARPPPHSAHRRQRCRARSPRTSARSANRLYCRAPFCRTGQDQAFPQVNRSVAAWPKGGGCTQAPAPPGGEALPGMYAAPARSHRCWRLGQEARGDGRRLPDLRLMVTCRRAAASQISRSRRCGSNPLAHRRAGSVAPRRCRKCRPLCNRHRCAP